MTDKDPFEKYHQVRESILKDLKKPTKKKVEMFVVDIIKEIVKSKEIPEREKFISLCLLKDLLKEKNIPLINYNSKKFLKRLFALATSPLKDQVLK